MSGHKFKIGQLVNYLGRDRAPSVYQITQLLPPEGKVFQYRIKNINEPHERVAKESELRRVWPSLEQGMPPFDYNAPAELFLAKRTKSSRENYRRFATAAEAIRYAVETLRTRGAWLEVGDERFNSSEIQRLYEADDYPLRKPWADFSRAASAMLNAGNSKIDTAIHFLPTGLTPWNWCTTSPERRAASASALVENLCAPIEPST
jgi:hypothetical protein